MVATKSWLSAEMSHWRKGDMTSFHPKLKWRRVCYRLSMPRLAPRPNYPAPGTNYNVCNAF